MNNLTTNTATNASVTIGSSSTAVLAANLIKQFVILTPLIGFMPFPA